MTINYLERCIETKNGTKVPVLLMQDPGVEHILTLGSVNIGRGNEIDTESAHALEHLVFTGSKKFPSKKEVKDCAADVGGWVNAETSDENTFFISMMPSDNYFEGMDLVTDIMFEPLLEDKQLQSVQDAISVELGGRMRSDIYKLMTLFVQAYFKEGTYGYRPMIDNRIESVKTLTAEQLREIHAQFYRPEHSSFFIGGNFDVNAVLENLQAMLNQKASDTPDKNLRILRKYEGHQYTHRTIEDDVKSEHLVMCLKAPDADSEDESPMAILNYILGGKPSARIPYRIREQEGLSYSTLTNFGHIVGKGLFIVRTDVKKGRTPDAEAMIIEELSRVRQGNIAKAEVEAVKTAVVGRLKTLDGTETKLRVLFSNHSKSGRVITPEEIIETRSRTTYQDVLRVAEKVIPEEFNSDTYASARIIAKKS